MKPQTRATKPPDAALSLHQELVAAIHGAFEVAVEIAVREVSKLVGQATGDLHEEMRRENESLKQRLERAEALLDSARMEEERAAGSSPPPPPDPAPPAGAKRHTDPHQKHPRKSPGGKVGDAHRGIGVGGGTPPADRPPDPQHEGPDGFGEQGPGGDAAPELKVEDNGVMSEDQSPMCVVKVESVTQTCGDPAAPDPDSPQLPCRDDESDPQQVTVKQEMPEGEREDAAFFLDSIKVEDLSSECMSAVQSKMLEEWKPEELSRDSHSPPSCTGPAQALAPDLTTSLPPPTDLHPLSPEFPNIFPPVEPAPFPEAPQKVYGVQVRSSRHPSHTSANLYACKSCSQTFHLPSLLRRHHGQCQQRLQSWSQQPAGGSKRSRLQLFPPGSSPFRCPECDREFNRMENLRTHLRIHTGERPYTCSVCGKCFRHSGALTRHFRIHTGEKPYVCGQCGKSFRNCGGLKFHQRSHSKQPQ